MLPELTFSSVRSAFFRDDDTLGSWIRTTLYFCAFIGALASALFSFPWSTLIRRRSPLVILAPAFSLAALLMTWRLILMFFVDFTLRHASHPDPPNLFVEAYVLVVDSWPGWLWSCTLLCWVAVACPVAHTEACRRGMPARTALAYIILAFLGAVSLAFPLFFAHLLVLPRKPTSVSRATPAAINASRGNRWLWPACTIAAVLSTLSLVFIQRVLDEQ